MIIYRYTNERLPLPTTTHDDDGAANCHNEDDSLRLLYGNLFFFFPFVNLLTTFL